MWSLSGEAVQIFEKRWAALIGSRRTWLGLAPLANRALTALALVTLGVPTAGRCVRIRPAPGAS